MSGTLLAILMGFSAYLAVATGAVVIAAAVWRAWNRAIHGNKAAKPADASKLHPAGAAAERQQPQNRSTGPLNASQEQNHQGE